MSKMINQGDDLAALYRIRFADSARVRKEAIWKVLCDDFFSKFVLKSDVVLDLACGYGEFINNITAGSRIGVDLNPDSRSCLHPGIAFFQSRADDLTSIEAGSVDVVFTSNFLEHLPDKTALMSVFAAIYRVLKPGGRFVVMGPNVRYLPGEYWDFLDHTLPLTHVSLCEGLQLAGFEPQVVHKKFLPYTTQGALPTHPLLVKVYLRVPFAWRLLGKQFFVVAQKSLQK